MRLLLAEDERDLSDVLVTILSNDNYIVDAVYDGESALTFCTEQHYDGIILDIMMPKKNGLDALMALRERGIATPVLLLTAKSEVEDRVKGLDIGANDYLAKPFATNELLARIRAMTRSASAFSPCEISLGNVTLNCSTFELTNSTSSIRLSSKEYKMMEMLMKNIEKTTLVEQFSEQIWGAGNDDTEHRIVWVYVSYLQNKLKAIGASLEIKSSETDGTICLLPSAPDENQ
ncbi:MAG: response regulator transcription factor [Clostridiales Family XIII bacterium]|jgi:DNA-binding response OmpR family regulator|nr:response regulator transcription factor [Clostridiales Family XIII bacterium]